MKRFLNTPAFTATTTKRIRLRAVLLLSTRGTKITTNITQLKKFRVLLLHHKHKITATITGNDIFTNELQHFYFRPVQDEWNWWWKLWWLADSCWLPVYLFTVAEGSVPKDEDTKTQHVSTLRLCSYPRYNSSILDFSMSFSERIEPGCFQVKELDQWNAHPENKSACYAWNHAKTLVLNCMQLLLLIFWGDYEELSGECAHFSEDESLNVWLLMKLCSTAELTSLIVFYQERVKDTVFYKSSNCCVSTLVPTGGETSCFLASEMWTITCPLICSISGGV